MRVIVALALSLSLALPAVAAELDLRRNTQVPLGVALRECVDSGLELQFLLRAQEYGEPHKQKDTVVLYDKKRNLVHVVMLGSSETADGAKLRLESRVPPLKAAVKMCAGSLGVDDTELLDRVDFIYTHLDRDKGKSKELLRWYQGKWELL